MKQTTSEKELLITHQHAGWVGDMARLSYEELETLFATITIKKEILAEGDDFHGLAYFSEILNKNFGRIISFTRSLHETLPNNHKNGMKKPSSMVAEEVKQFCSQLHSLQKTLDGLHELTKDYVESIMPFEVRQSSLGQLSDVAWNIEQRLAFHSVEVTRGSSKSLATLEIEGLYNLYEAMTGEIPKKLPFDGSKDSFKTSAFREFVECYFGYMPKDVLDALKIQRHNMASIINETIEFIQSDAQSQ